MTITHLCIWYVVIKIHTYAKKAWVSWDQQLLSPLEQPVLSCCHRCLSSTHHFISGSTSAHLPLTSNQTHANMHTHTSNTIPVKLFFRCAILKLVRRTGQSLWSTLNKELRLNHGKGTQDFKIKQSPWRKYEILYYNHPYIFMDKFRLCVNSFSAVGSECF